MTIDYRDILIVDPKQLVAISKEKAAKAISFTHKSIPYLVVDILFNKECDYQGRLTGELPSDSDQLIEASRKKL